MQDWTALNEEYLSTIWRVKYSQNSLVAIALICIFKCKISIIYVSFDERHVFILNNNLLCINCSQINICF